MKTAEEAATELAVELANHGAILPSDIGDIVQFCKPRFHEQWQKGMTDAVACKNAKAQGSVNNPNTEWADAYNQSTEDFEQAILAARDARKE